MTWLRQYEPGCGAVLLRDFRGELVEIVCPKCERAGRYRRDRLAERCGPRAGLPAVLVKLSAGCTRRGVGRFGDPCGAYFAGLGKKPTG